MYTLLQDPFMSPATAPRAPHIVPQRNGGILDNPKISGQKWVGLRESLETLEGPIPAIESCPANLTTVALLTNVDLTKHTYLTVIPPRKFQSDEDTCWHRRFWTNQKEQVLLKYRIPLYHSICLVHVYIYICLYGVWRWFH